MIKRQAKVSPKHHAKMCMEVQEQLDDAVTETVNLIKDARFHLRNKAAEKLEELKLSFSSFEMKSKNLEKMLEAPQEIDDLYRLRNKLSSRCKDLVSTYKEMHFRMNLTDPDLQELFSSYSVFVSESTRDLHEEKLKLIVESIKLFKKMINLVIDKINSQEENNDSDCQTNG